MGYLATGYAFACKPDWARISRSLPAYNVRGYKHKERQLWLLDAWKTTLGGEKHVPFYADPIQACDFEPGNNGPVSEIAVAFDKICDVLRESESVYYEPGWLGVPLSIANAALTSTFAFTADDEVYDFATLIDSNAFIHIGCRFELFNLELDQGAFRVTPYNQEEGGEAPSPDLLSKLAAVRNIQVMKPENIDGGFRIYQHPTDLWPAEWGDCKDLLGFGTVNPFENFEEKFALVYDASRPSSTEREQPWWKPWGKAPTPKNDIGCLVAIASCLLWPVGIFLACAYLLKSRQREAVQAGLIGVLGIMLMQILSAIDVSIKQTGRLEYLNLAYIGYSVVAVFAAIVVHSWLKQQPWLSGR